MNRYIPVVDDEAKFPESVHESADAGSGGADHLCQCFLIDIGTDWLRASFVAEMREYRRIPPDQSAEKSRARNAVDLLRKVLCE
jgi:hypothetical protein